MNEQSGIVIELQKACLDQEVPASSILRKAKVIAAKLELEDLRQWINAEINGYTCAPSEMPEHRTGLGTPKFLNPYHGWRPIQTSDDFFGRTIRTVHLTQPISELEELARSDNGGSGLIMYYSPKIEEIIQSFLPTRMECGLHFSKSQVINALEYVRNKTLDWTLELEGRGVVGEGLTFADADKKEAQIVTNHIYGSSIGVLGTVGRDAKISHLTSTISPSPEQALELVTKIREASGGLPAPVRDALEAPLVAMEKAAKEKKPSLIQEAMDTMVPILQNASGSLVASSILAAIGIG